MASQPTAMAARNWMLRRLMLETIRNDPDYNRGNYITQPRMMKYAINAFGLRPPAARWPISRWPRPQQGRQDGRRPAGAAITADANDFVYQWEASHDYDPSQSLEKIEATLLINAADDERNPPETGITDAALKRIKNARLFLIPASARPAAISPRATRSSTRSTCEELLQTAPQRTM